MIEEEKQNGACDTTESEKTSKLKKGGSWWSVENRTN